MKGMMTVMPDGRYELRSFAVDEERANVSAYAVFHGTHTGPGARCRRPARARRPTMSDRAPGERSLRSELISVTNAMW
jgi:hypothetical protein